MEVLRRYSNRTDLLGRLVNVMELIKSDPSADVPSDPLVSADDPGPRVRRLNERLDAADRIALAESYLGGATIEALSKRYDIGTTSVKRILREQGARKRRPKRDM